MLNLRPTMLIEEIYEKLVVRISKTKKDEEITFSLFYSYNS